MSRTPRRGLLAAVLVWAVAASVSAQSSLAPSRQEMMDEARVVRATLDAVQARAMQDESLAGKAEALVRDVESRMTELEPETVARLARIEELETQLASASQGQDQQARDAILTEARGLGDALERTRSRVLQEEAYSLRTMAFQRELVDAMTVIEPDTPRLLRRLEEIARALEPRP